MFSIDRMTKAYFYKCAGSERMWLKEEQTWGERLVCKVINQFSMLLSKIKGQARRVVCVRASAYK